MIILSGISISRCFQVIHLPFVALALVLWSASAGGEPWEGYPRLTREELRALIAQTPQGSKPEIYGRNLSDADLSAMDFRGANLSASVLNGAKLMRSTLDRCNFTVSFLEGPISLALR